MTVTVTAPDDQKESLPSTTEEVTDDKPTRRGNPLMRGLYAAMLKDPHKLDFADGMMSNEFAWEKTSKLIIDALEIGTEKEWLDYAKAVWKWREDAEKREAESYAEKFLAEAANRPLLLKVLKQKLAA